MHHNTIKRPLDLETLILAPGPHLPNTERRMNVMEAVAYVACEPWSHRPQCASPVLASFCNSWNFAPEPYGPAIREGLKHYIPRLVGSLGTAAQEEMRAWLALDWLQRESLPAWLRLAGLTEHAETLASLPQQMSRASVEASAAAWNEAEDATWAAANISPGFALDWKARGAAKHTAEQAQSFAAVVAAQAAAWATIRAVAGNGTSDTAWGTTWDKAFGTLSGAAWHATRCAAWNAAGAAVKADVRDAGEGAAIDIAVAAAETALRPTVEHLQASAWQLLERMLAFTEHTPDA